MATMVGAAINGHGAILVAGAGLAAPATGVEDAFAAYAPEIRAYVTARFGGRVAAEDVTQEAFARLVREATAGRMPRTVRPWLYRVAHNLAVSELRRPGRDTVDPDAPGGRPEPPSPSAEDEFDLSAISSELRQALAALPVPARASILMSAGGYSGREIASATGRSELAVRALLCRTRRALREALGAESMARPAMTAELVA